MVERQAAEKPAAHQPGDPTPVPGGQVGPGRYIAEASMGCLGELLTEVVGGLVLLVLTTASLAGAYLLARALHQASPAGAYGLAAVGLLGLAHGIRHWRRPKEQRSRVGRITAAVTGALGFWLILCVGYASFDAACGLNIGL
ncbi:hypothetical protein ACGF12_10530 [Kitasatospora sp. NPDC048296]|uniref:hypothetical protein n=1 Tax=Kitasatospora sp. NPDC048296 TaxID=3364048 RepID=UPI003713F27D